MSAPTLWEEGRWSATRVTRLAVLALVLLTAIDLLRIGELGIVFDAGFVILCIGVALAVRPEDFFRIGVLPPILLLVLDVLLAIGHREAVGAGGDGLIQAVIAGLAHHAGALFAGYALCLTVLGIRQRVLARHGVEADLVGPQVLDRYSNLDVSPAPYRVISGAPAVKSTTVDGSDPDSPSMTASNS